MLKNSNTIALISMKASRLVALIRKFSPYSKQKSTPFSSSSPSNPRLSGVFSGVFSGESDGGSQVYRQVLKFKRPTDVKFHHQQYNSVSFIGSVYAPIKVNKKTEDRFGVYTWLTVKTSRDSDRTFRILLQMWNEMAKISQCHLKPNDFIYVSGRLGSFTNTSGNGRTYYKVTVKEMNYVARNGKGSACTKIERAERGGEGDVGKPENRLCLWQVFFVNPHEWWDNGKNKPTPSHPDFKRKDTGEALWMRPDDPPWLKRQLQLHDSRIKELGPAPYGSPCLQVGV